MSGRPPSKASRGDLKKVCEDIRLTRRMVTAMLLSSAGAAAAGGANAQSARAPQPAQPQPAQRTRQPLPAPSLRPIPAFRPRPIRVVRPDDMLILDVLLDNLVIQGQAPAQRLVRVDPARPGLLVVEHQPQAVADQAYQETVGQNIQVDRDGNKASQPQTSEPSPVPPQVAQARMAGKSRVVFRMPTSEGSHPWTLDGLLDACRTWPMVLDYTALPAPVDSWRLGNAGAALGVLQARLDHAAEVLRANLPAAQQAAVSQTLANASVRVGAAINDGIRRGQPLSEGDIDQMIAQELQAGLGPAATSRNDQELLYASRLLEAAAVSCAITLAQAEEPSTNAPPPRRRISPITPLPAQQTPAPTTAAPATRPPFVFVPPVQQPSGRQPPPSQPANPPTYQPPSLRAPPQAQPPVFHPQGPPQGATIGPVQNYGPIVQLIYEPHKPSDTVTALEIPYRLFQSPLATAGWAHALDLVTHNHRTELWHTRLGTRGSSGVDDKSPEPLRAIWSYDYPPDAPVDPTPPPYWALNGQDRRMLVKLTTGYNEKQQSGGGYGTFVPGAKAYTPKPSIAKRLMLTALGGWLDLEGQWDIRPQGVDIEAWSHKTAMARDYYVRVVYAGFLFPFGHAASLVKVTERKFETQSDGNRAAVLRQRFFIIVRERIRNYPGPNQAFQGRDLPFDQVEILTRVTPNLVPPGSDFPGDPPGNDRLSDKFYGYDASLWREAFFPETSTGDFLFQMVGVDGAGRRTSFSAPLFFISELRNKAADIGDSATADTIAWKYATSAKNGAARCTVHMNGSVIQFAPQTVGGDSNGDTNIPTGSISFHGVKPTSPIDFHQPQFYPSAVQAEVLLPAVKHLLGSDKAPTVKFNKAFLDGGFSPANKGQVFLDIVSSVSLPVDAGNPTDKFGGMISPNLAPNALSRSFGIVTGAPDPALGNAAKFLQGEFNPSDFLPGDAKLLGAIPLKDVLNVINIISHPEQAPKLANLDLPDRVEVSFSISQGDLNSPVPLFAPNDDTVLTINAKIVIKRDGSPPQASVDGSMNDFQVNLFGFIILSFDNLSFHGEPGKKPDVSVDLNPDHGVQFGGPLEFVNTLKDLIPSNGFSDPPSLSVTPTGISASYSLGLPTVAVGVLSLQNISFGAGFDLPFTGDPPSTRFNFAERQNPFNLTVSLFGGGGFFAITIDTGGVRELEASLEFGASISIDLGVASGGVYIKGGFYFHWKDAPDSLVYFEGYVELGGHLSILCLITVSLVFHLALVYQKSGGMSELFGQATLNVEIDILFFSFSVGVTVTKQFAGSSDPRFIDFIPDDATWRQYCGAFG